MEEQLTFRFTEVSEQLEENKGKIEKRMREEGFLEDLALMRRQVDNVNKVNDTAFFALCISGLAMIAIGASMKTKPSENQAR